MMLLRALFCSLLILLCNTADAQYEWVKENTPYIRIKTAQNGIYYLTAQSLTNAGMPAEAHPRTLQLFRRGKEIKIHVSGEADGSFDTEDTLYFYGQRNDGIPDSSLYIKAADQLHPWLNLYSDTAVYFLSWGTQNGLRMSSQNTTPIEVAAFHQAKTSKCFFEDYARGKVLMIESYSSKFDVGEGWCSAPFTDSYTFTLDDIHDVYPGIDATLDIKIVGRNWFNAGRKVIVKLGNPLSPDYQDTIEGLPFYDKGAIVFTFPSQLLSNNTLQVTLEPIAVVGKNPNRISVYYCSLNYAQMLSAPASYQKVYRVLGNTTNQTASLAWASPSPLVFDITDPDQVALLPHSYNGSVLSVTYSQDVDSFLVISRTSLLEPLDIRLKQYSFPDMQSDYYIVSHSNLRESVLQYADYRGSNAGGNYIVDIEWIDEIYDMFSYGEITPLALYRYGDYLYTHNTDARFLTLIGSGVDHSFQRTYGYYRWNSEAFHNETDEKLRLINLIPTAGSPGSDLLFVMDKDLYPQLAIGRVPGESNIEVLQYLDKVVEHEAVTVHEKNLIHISGGNIPFEADVFAAVTNGWQTIVENSIWKGTVTRSIHKTDFPSIMNISIAEEVNAGVSFISFFGHASAQIADPNFGYVSADSNGYNNKGKYPMIITAGCEAGNIFSNYSLLEDWVATPDRGAIVAVGCSEVNYTQWGDLYVRYLYKYLFEEVESIGNPVGEIINKVLNDRTYKFNDLLQTQMILCGDPAVVVNADQSQDVTTISLEDHTSYMMIRPNPNQGVFTLESKIEGLIKIINANGLQVYESKILAGVNIVRVQLPPGMYVARLVGLDKEEQLKILIY